MNDQLTNSQAEPSLSNTVVNISVEHNDFDIAQEYAALRSVGDSHHADIGAIVTFVGLVRDLHIDANSTAAKTVQWIELQHYPAVTAPEINKLAQQAASQFKVEAIRVIHRVGKLAPNEQIVFVGVAGKHREQAFLAAEMVMDYLKSAVPIWKKEHRTDVSGDSDAVWIEPKQQDYVAAQKWDKKKWVIKPIRFITQFVS